MFSTWYGFRATAGTSAGLVDLLQNSLVSALARPDVRERLIAMGAELVGLRVDEFVRRIQADTAKYEALIRRSMLVRNSRCGAPATSPITKEFKRGRQVVFADQQRHCAGTPKLAAALFGWLVRWRVF